MVFTFFCEVGAERPAADRSEMAKLEFGNSGKFLRASVERNKGGPLVKGACRMARVC